MYRWLVLVVLLPACVEASLLPCGSVLCPTSAVCMAEENRCVTMEQLVACADLADDSDCVIGANTGKCMHGACTATSCGNALVEPGEDCDDGNRISGDDCSFDCRSTEVCGNGYVDFVRGEQCDDGNLEGNDACEPSCQLPRCGDGALNTASGETCDDSNRMDGDGCSRDCLSNETCGNGVRDPGEECDDGNLVDHDGCQSNCRVQRCGDAIVDSGEQCDDGNFEQTDACTNVCKNAVCGDGQKWVGHEQCDDGNLYAYDACTTACKLATCGDGFTFFGTELCDDGNQNELDCCRSNCSPPPCGDGIKQCSEICDDGNTVNTDTCRNQCRLKCDPNPPGVVWYMELATAGGDPASEPMVVETVANGEFGGGGYGGGVVMDLQQNRYYVLQPDNLTNTSSTDLTFVSGTGFVNTTTSIRDESNYCSSDGNGVWSAGVHVEWTDACGDVFTNDLSAGDVTASNWPVCTGP